MPNGGPTGKSLTPFEMQGSTEELAEWFQVGLQDLEVQPLLAGKLSLQRAALSPEGLRVRRGVRSGWTLASLGREAAVTGAATGSGCEPGWAGALQIPGPGLWGRQMLRGLSQPPRPQLCCKSTPSEGLQPCNCVHWALKPHS